MIGGFRQVIAKEGAGALLTGAGPTFAGYFLQGAFKFGGYEFFKQQSINMLGYETASNNRTAVYLASSACAEFFAVPFFESFLSSAMIVSASKVTG